MDNMLDPNKLSSKKNRNALLSFLQKRWINLLLIAVIIIIDQGTKLFFNAYLVFAVPKPIFPGFNLTLLHNKGAAFSLLDDGSFWEQWSLAAVSAVVCLGILVLLVRTAKPLNLMNLGLTFVFAGALSNLYDRVINGYVVDFLDFYVSHWHWPAFNVADASIVVGIAMVIWSTWD